MLVAGFSVENCPGQYDVEGTFGSSRLSLLRQHATSSEQKKPDLAATFSFK